MKTSITHGKRVERHTSKKSLEMIKDITISNIQKFSISRADLDMRIENLDNEWDIERYLETNASVIAFAGIVLGAFVHVYWFILPAVVLLFLFQHAIQGWCPPLPIFRKLGKRTKREIEIEKHALKALREDYELIDGPVSASRLLASKKYLLPVIKAISGKSPSSGLANS